MLLLTSLLLILLSDHLVLGQTKVIRIALLYTEETGNAPIAFQQAIEEVNSDVEWLPGVTLEGSPLDIGSDNDNPAEAVNQMCRMLEREDVMAVVGPFSSSQVKSCSYVAHRIELPLIAPTATDPDLTNPHWSESLQKLSPSNIFQAEALVDLVQHFGWRRVSIVYTSEPYGVTLAEEMRSKLNKKGIKVITELEIGFDLNPSAETMRGWIEQLQNAVTRVTLLLTHPECGVRVLEAAQDNGMIGSQYVWVASTGIAEAITLGFTEDGRLKPQYDGLIGISAYLDTTGGFYKRLARAYRDNNVTLITPADALVYDAVYLLAHGLNGVVRGLDGDLEFVENFAGDCYSESLTNQWTSLTTSLKIQFTFSYTGITGARSMWPDGNPAKEKIRYSIVNFAGDTVSPVGQWRQETKVTLSSEVTWYEGERVTPIDSPNLVNVTLKLGVLEDKPFIIYNYTRHNYSRCEDMPNKDWCYTGVSIDIIKDLQKKLKFSYEFIEPEDGKFGSISGGEWNGIIRDIYKKKVDVGVVGFGTSHSREKAVDFGISFLPGGVRMATRMKAVETNPFFFLKPFSTGVWIAIIVGILFFFVAIHVLDWYSPYGHAGSIRFKCSQCQCEKCAELTRRGGFRDNLCPFEEDHALKHQMGTMSKANALWLSVCSFLTYAPADAVPKNWSARIVITVWWMVCLVLVSMYTANLAAFLTVRKMTVDINSISDLLDQNEYSFGTVEGTVTENLIQYGNSKEMQNVAKRMNSTDTFKGAIDRMRQRKYIFMYGRGPLEYSTQTEFCDLKLVGDVIVHFGYAFAFQQGSTYKEAFNREMLSMQEKGVIMNYWDNYISLGTCQEDKEFDFEADKLEIKSLIGLLIIALPVIVIAIILLITELFASPKGHAGKRMLLIALNRVKPPYPRTTTSSIGNVTLGNGMQDIMKHQLDLAESVADGMELNEESVDLTTELDSVHASLARDDFEEE
uniref:Putative ionotropic glutamate receptor n=1 Tax=Hormiphora californensis TaxID=1403702 RepID=V9PPY3_HORCA|nr:putative ionotropic glutamate receptor [Hormiphora californensis]